MTPNAGTVQNHYDHFLSQQYLWMAGGLEENIRTNLGFFSDHGIIPAKNSIAVDLGAGCGFQSIALARTGFSVISVDFCEPMRDILRQNSSRLQVRIIQTDMLAFDSWAGQNPDLITCMGDTITHLSDRSIAGDLIRHCAEELVVGGKIVLSFRDYFQEPEDTVVIPIRRDSDRIFLCRLEYRREKTRVTDIIYSRKSGRWSRAESTYPKICIGRKFLTNLVADEGFAVLESWTDSGVITLITQNLGRRA